MTNFKDFDDYMTQFFDKVYDPLWMQQKPRADPRDALNREPSFSLSGIENEKVYKDLRTIEEVEKYREKVHEYTHYDIGRKIPESVPCFSEEEIRGGHLVTKSP